MLMQLPKPPRRLFLAKEERKMATQHWAWQLASLSRAVAEDSTRQSMQCKSGKTSCNITASQTNSRARPGKSNNTKPAYFLEKHLMPYFWDRMFREYKIAFAMSIRPKFGPNSPAVGLNNEIIDITVLFFTNSCSLKEQRTVLTRSL